MSKSSPSEENTYYCVAVVHHILHQFHSLGLIQCQWLNHPCHEHVDHLLCLNQCQFHVTKAAEFRLKITGNQAGDISE